MKKVRVVAATTKSQDKFWQGTLLGKSLRMFPKQPGLVTSIFPQNSGPNRKGLGAIYNIFLQAEYADEILLFVHDDVFVHDWHLVQRLNDGLAQFDVVGLAGNRQPDLSEPAWLLAWDKEKYPRGRQNQEFLSGAVCHLVNGKTRQSVYGPTPQECVLLDGLFLAVNARRVIEENIRFDTQFEFHLYDLDFCRQCHSKGLKLGTWPIAVTHASGGQFNSSEWQTGRDLYLDKWRSDWKKSRRHGLSVTNTMHENENLT